MKNFIVNCGNGLINFCAWLLLIIIVLLGIGYMFTNAGVGLGILIGGFIVFVLSFYFLYMLMDIRDNLKEIKNNTKISANEVLNPEEAQYVRYCQACGEKYSKDEEHCPNCNTPNGNQQKKNES